MIKKISFILALALQSTLCFAAPGNNNFLLQNSKPKHIFINNRILAKVNGKPISVIDVMKKLDLVFFRQFPQYASSTEARHQFYIMNWKPVLKELIEKELIMADAQEVKMEVSRGDIRQEMENMFGPNIIANLDKAGLSYEEAWEMIKEDQILKRMMISRVNSKVMRSVTPVDIRSAYEDYATTNAEPDAWTYRAISFKGDESTLCAEAANYAHQLLTEDGVSIDSLEEKIEAHPLFGDSVKCQISGEITQTSKEASESYREILASLSPNSFSKPAAQRSRAKNTTIFRIIYLEEFRPGGPPRLAEVETKLKNKLTEKKADQEAEKYIAKLRKHFDVQGADDNYFYSEDFQPFTLN